MEKCDPLQTYWWNKEIGESILTYRFRGFPFHIVSSDDLRQKSRLPPLHAQSLGAPSPLTSWLWGDFSDPSPLWPSTVLHT